LLFRSRTSEIEKNLGMRFLNCSFGIQIRINVLTCFDAHIYKNIVNLSFRVRADSCIRASMDSYLGSRSGKNS